MPDQRIITPEQAADQQGYAAYLRAMEGPQAKRVLSALWQWPVEKLERMVAALERIINENK